MNGKEKITRIKKLGFKVRMISKKQIRAQKNGYIANGTINQVFEDIRHGGARI